MSKAEDSIMEGLSTGIFNSDLETKDIKYDPTGNPNSARVLDEAARNGLAVRFPKDNELFIDIDNDHSFEMFKKQLDILKKYVGVLSAGGYYTCTPSKSGLPKRHVVVTLRDSVTEVERCALQAMMGSDRVRELLGYVQAKNNDPHPTLFIERK